MDAVFLYVETDHAPLNVLGMLVLESLGRGPAEDFRRIHQQLERRVPGLPALRRKLLEVPLGLDHPLWAEDPAFDLDAHLHRVALPAPGGSRELSEFVARIAERPLRRDRPLWEMYVVEGLERRRFALVAKIHHAIADGVASLQLLAGLFDSDAAGGALLELPQPAPGSTPAPSGLALLASASLAAGARSLRAARQIWHTGSAGARLLQESWTRGPTAATAAQRTLLNRRVSGRRSVAIGSVALSDVHEVKRAFKATVNHVVLAACAGALRRYLALHGEILRRPLLAAVPMAFGPRAADGFGNALSLVRVRLPVHVADPVERLCAARDASDEAIRSHEMLGDQLGPWADLASPALLAGASRLYAGLGLAERLPLCSVLISNVQGPATPLYCAGSRMTACVPFGPIYDGFALNLTVMSYAGSLGMGAIACREAVPDLDKIPREFEACVAQLRGLAAPEARDVAVGGAPAEAIGGASMAGRSALAPP